MRNLIRNLCTLAILSGATQASAGVPIEHSSKKLKALRVAAQGPVYTRNYVHRWIPYPVVKIPFVRAGAAEKRPELGQVEVDFFLASWCVPCQEITLDLKRLEKKFEKLDVRFTYIFSHDLKSDVQGYLQSYKLKDGGMATHGLLKEFHNPPLPTIYISDKRGWLLTRFENIKLSQLPEVENLLTLLTSF